MGLMISFFRAYPLQTVLMLVALVLGLFSFGLPVIMFVVLWRNRDRLTTDDDFIELWGTLYTLYRPEYFFFESIMMGFKLLLLMALVFFEQGTQFQDAAVLIVTFIQIGVHAKTTPYRTAFDNNLQFCGTALTFISAFGGLLLGYVDVTRREAKLRTIGEEQDMLMEKYDAQTSVVRGLVDAATLCVFAAYAVLGFRHIYGKRREIRAGSANVVASVNSLRRPSKLKRLVLHARSGFRSSGWCVACPTRKKT